MKFSIVIPAHNESSILGETVTNVQKILAEKCEEYEIVLVENGSTDDTRSLCESLASIDGRITALSLSAGDYGRALRYGISESAHDAIVIFDADFYSVDFVNDVLRILADDADTAVIVASKRNKDSVDARSGYRKTGTRVLNAIMRLVFGLKVSDTHGMKYINRALLRQELERTREAGSLYDTALILRAEKNGKKIRDVACTVMEMRAPRTKFARRALQTLYSLVRLRITLGRETGSLRR